jgi:cysteine desulfurase
MFLRFLTIYMDPRNRLLITLVREKMKKIYLDYAATAPADPAAVKAMLPYFDSVFANPSSAHSAGREAREAVAKARETIASILGALPEEIVFTSGGTESNNYALKGIARSIKGNRTHIITSSVEHPSVSKPCRSLEKDGYAITYLPVDRHGLVDPDEVRRAINSHTCLISIMHANNESGSVQPIADIAGIAHEHGIIMHTDAVQSFAHMPVSVDELSVDMLSASAHKFYGPKGVGFLYVLNGLKLTSFMEGGGQEMGRRSSTCNVPGIVGMARAAELASERMESENAEIRRLANRLIKGIRENIDDAVFNGHPEKRLHNIVSVTVGDVPLKNLLRDLDAEGIYCSAGAACSASSWTETGAREEGADSKSGALRLSLGRYTTEGDIDYTIDVLAKTVKALRGK